MVGLEVLADDARFATNSERVRHYAELREFVAIRLRERTRAEWIRALHASGVPCGSVRTVGEVLEDEHLHARDMIQTVEHAVLGPLRVLGVPVKLSATPGAVRSAPPTLGQDTERILRHELGVSDDDLAALRAARTI